MNCSTNGKVRRVDSGLSAMVRLRNEEEFLLPSIRSIAGEVDEIVIIDNLSEDATPSMIDTLTAEYPDKVVSCRYPHAVGRVGEESWRLSTRGQGDSSPSLSANYYNWCLEKCTGRYVLKWDGDMIALPAFAEALERWRRSCCQVLVFRGANVHPSLTNLVKAKSDDREALLSRLRVPGLPSWATSLTYDFPEPRLFLRKDARYTTRILWTQEFSSPAFSEGRETDGLLEADEPLYLHMKFCKREPFSNYSDDLAQTIAANITLGPELDSTWGKALRMHLALPRP
jgi:glycosyltransferase involved in cell wall biosynthesis